MGTTMRVLAGNPRAGYLSCKEAVQAAIAGVLESGVYILGEQVARFEEEFAAYLGVGSALGVGSGTDALHLALRACGIGPGHRVITVSHTAVATVAAVHLAGAEPVLVDVDPRSHTLDPDRLEATLRQDDRGIRAVVPVHLYGHPADMPAIREVADRHGLQVIEDCAQAHGALLGNQPMGSFGQAGAFSFYPTKNLGAFGDGGACVFNDAELATRGRLLRQYGWRERYVSDQRGMNTRLDELQAAVLRVKLPALDQANDRRRRIACQYGAHLRESHLLLPAEVSGARHVYHQYVVRSPRREELRAFLQQHGVGTAVLYPVPVHLQPAYAGSVEVGAGGLAVTERLCREVLSLPMYPELTDDEVEMVCRLILDFDRSTGVR